MKHLLISLLLLSSVNISAQTTVVKRQQKQQTTVNSNKSANDAARKRAEANRREQERQNELRQEQLRKEQEERLAKLNSPVIGTSTYTPIVNTYTVDGITFQMVEVRGGTFHMGHTSEQEVVGPNETPVHEVTLSNYYIGQTEVTQALWQAIMGNNPSRYIGSNLPVHKVSWNDCQDFIMRLNQKTGKHFRLPTESEWEFAARGGIKSQGTQFSGAYSINNCAWYEGNSGNTPHPVATKQPNELGIYDMNGNASEWCQDWYGGYSSTQKYKDPIGPNSGSSRVIRGGAWFAAASLCRVSRRNAYKPDEDITSGGLRLALSE